MTIEELEENLKEAVNAATGSARLKLAHAKLVGMACDVSEPVDVKELGKFAADELGYIDIWVSSFLFLHSKRPPQQQYTPSNPTKWGLGG